MSITGNLRTLEFEELLQWLAQGRKTGTLTIANGTVQKSISLKNGRIIASASSDPKERLGRFLVDQGYIDESTLEHALKLQEATQMSVGKVLVSLGSLSEADLGRLLRQKTEESIYDLFFWPEGDFEFQQEESSRLAMVPLSLDVTQVLLEGMRRLDEWKAGNGEADWPLPDDVDEMFPDDGAKTVAIEPPPLPDPVEDTEPDVEVSYEATAIAVDEELGESGASRAGGSQRKIITSIAASLLAVAGLGWALVSLRASEPGEPVNESPGAERRLVEAVPRPDRIAQRVAALPAASNPELGLALAGISPPGSGTATAQDPNRETILKARYEEELAALRRELAEARRVAVEEDPSVPEPQPVAEPEPVREAVAAAPAFEPPAPAPEIPAPTPQVAAAVPAAAEPSASSAIDSSRTEPISAVKRPEPRNETADSESNIPVSPRSSQLETRVTPKPAPPPPPRQPRTRRGDLVSAGPGVVPPKLVRPPAPRYPLAAQRVGREGQVRLRVLVDENGRPAEIRQVGPEIGMGFDKAALKAAEQAVWEPASKNGVKVKMWFDLVIQFKL